MNSLKKKAELYLDTLCKKLGNRAVGSKGNRDATVFFRDELQKLNWKTDVSELKVIDWKTDGAYLVCEDSNFEVLSSPYSLGCDIEGQLVGVSNIDQLEILDAKSKIIFLYGDIAKEQLMPKNFVFYNPDEHQKIVSILEKSRAKAIICATGRNSELAGGSYPFPLIEDGDFDIPSVYMTDIEGEKLMVNIGKTVSLKSYCNRVEEKGYNVVASSGNDGVKKIVITAHIDAKKGSPGALDNAGGVIVLLLLADLLKDYSGKYQIEIVAFNGEDYYAVPGQMDYIKKNEDKFDNIFLNINIDGAGYKNGKTVFSFYDIEEDIRDSVELIVKKYNDIKEGIQWPQGDHSIFVQKGVPAIAVSSEWLIDNMECQDVTHTEKDAPELIDCDKLVEISYSLAEVITELK